MRTYNFVILGALLFIACQQPVKQVVIDNPSDEDIRIGFDETEAVNVPAVSTKEVSIQFGKSTVTMNGEKVGMIELNPDYDYIINPLKATYYIEESPYFSTQAAKDKYISDYGEPVSDIDGLEVNGDYTKISNQLQIRKSWTVGLDEDVGSQLNLKTRKETVIIKKLHREKDLKESLWQGAIDYLQENKD